MPTAQGGHWPQFSRSKKPATDAATASGQADAPTTRTAPVPSAVPVARSASGSSGTSRSAGAERASPAGPPGKTRPTASVAPPACSSITAPQGRAERHLVDARPPHVAPDASRASSRRADTPRGRRAPRARARASRRSARASGRPSKPDRGRQRRLGPRPGPAALERLEQRRLLAGDVAVVAAADLDRQAVERRRGDRAPRAPPPGASNEPFRKTTASRAPTARAASARPATTSCGRLQHDEAVLVASRARPRRRWRPRAARRPRRAPPATCGRPGTSRRRGRAGRRRRAARRGLPGSSAWRAFVAKGVRLLTRRAIIRACEPAVLGALPQEDRDRPALRAGRAILHKIVQMV